MNELNTDRDRNEPAQVAIGLSVEERRVVDPAACNARTAGRTGRLMRWIRNPPQFFWFLPWMVI